MQPVTKVQRSGNAEVQELLEHWLAKAREGNLRYVAMVGCVSPMDVDVAHAGSQGMEFSANYGFDLLKRNLFGTLRNPEQGLSADYVRYDISRAPIGFDFASWLIDQEMTRVRMGAAAPLKVAFVGDISRRRWGPFEQQMLERVMRPLIPMIGAVENPHAATATTNREFYMLRYVTEAAKRGENVPQFRAPDALVTKFQGIGNYVTITLREAEHWPHRNSNMEAWTQLAHELRRRGEDVVIVRDTAKAAEPFEDFTTLPAASVDLQVRAALYDQAKCNLFPSNGPWYLALFGRRPWLMFNQVSDDDHFDANKGATWRDFHGVAPGEQFPWQQADQRIIWETDNYDVMIRAWDELQLPAAMIQAAE